MDTRKLVIVGVDGSAEAREALRYAATEAANRSATLRVVSVFESAGSFGTRYAVPIPVSDQEITEKIDTEMRGLIREIVDVLPHRPDVQLLVRPGSPAKVLTDESASADLLVVGHRGMGGFASLLLGSVGLQCVLHARCPVTVVRPRSAFAGHESDGHESGASGEAAAVRA